MKAAAVILALWLIYGGVSAACMVWAAWRAPLDVELWPGHDEAPPAEAGGGVVERVRSQA